MWVGMCSLPSCLKPREGLQTIPPEETLFIQQVYMRQSLEAIEIESFCLPSIPLLLVLYPRIFSASKYLFELSQNFRVVLQ